MAALGDEELRQLLTAFGVGSEAELLVRLQRRVERSSSPPRKQVVGGEDAIRAHPRTIAGPPEHAAKPKSGQRQTRSRARRSLGAHYDDAVQRTLSPERTAYTQLRGVSIGIMIDPALPEHLQYSDVNSMRWLPNCGCVFEPCLPDGATEPILHNGFPIFYADRANHLGNSFCLYYNPVSSLWVLGDGHRDDGGVRTHCPSGELPVGETTWKHNALASNASSAGPYALCRSATGRDVKVDITLLYTDADHSAFVKRLKLARKARAATTVAAAQKQLQGAFAIALDGGLHDCGQACNEIYRRASRHSLEFRADGGLKLLYDRHDDEWMLLSPADGESESCTERSPPCLLAWCSGLGYDPESAGFPLGEQEWHAYGVDDAEIYTRRYLTATTLSSETEIDDCQRKKNRSFEHIKGFRIPVGYLPLNRAGPKPIHFGSPAQSEAAALFRSKSPGAIDLLRHWEQCSVKVAELRTEVLDYVEYYNEAREEAATAASAARAVLLAERKQENEASCPLLQLLSREDIRHHILSGELFGVVGLWRLRMVCSALDRWAVQALETLPRPVILGGFANTSGKKLATAESLDLSTMKWSRCKPLDLPAPRTGHSVAFNESAGTLRIVGGFAVAGGGSQLRDFDVHDSGTGGVEIDDMRGLQVQPPLEWNGSVDFVHRQTTNGTWSQLSAQPGSGNAELPDARRASHSATVLLPDGRMLVIGGLAELPDTAPNSEHDQDAASHEGDDNSALAPKVVTAAVHVLSADGRTWTAAASMHTPRYGAVAGLLPSGNVIVAGGQKNLRSEDDPHSVHSLRSVEIWDAQKDEWRVAPPMLERRFGATGCVLPSGRFAVAGGRTFAGSYYYQSEVILSSCEVFVESSAEGQNCLVNGKTSTNCQTEFTARAQQL